MAPVVTGIGLAGPTVGDPAHLLGSGVAGREDFDPASVVGKRGLRYKDDATRLALAAAHRALTDAGLLDDRAPTVPAGQVAVVVSSNLGNLDTVCAAAETIARESVTGLSPMDLPNASSNVVASSVAIWFGLRGANLMVCNGATSGLDAVRWARVLVGSGRVRHALVVGVEVDNEVVRRLTGAERLFHGAAALVVESAANAAARGVTARATLGRYERRAVGAVPGTGLWLVPERHATAAPPGVTPLDLSRRYGAASGALGVLQCAAAATWIHGGHGPTALATAGGPEDDATATLLLSAPGPAR
ncbi:beta-ketoacyl synthase N-terminal-like domain-containing protein [Longispora sp. NPDC051575]|uniref:beta-ketoacyl synthase N-terminal-like domain-containing protein n=1 Tax=Longispora sp. NPDC051575 TaxID=3154943 RepID=UPI0034210CA6